MGLGIHPLLQVVLTWLSKSHASGIRQGWDSVELLYQEDSQCWFLVVLFWRIQLDSPQDTFLFSMGFLHQQLISRRRYSISKHHSRRRWELWAAHCWASDIAFGTFYRSSWSQPRHKRRETMNRSMGAWGAAGATRASSYCQSALGKPSPPLLLSLKTPSTLLPLCHQIQAPDWKAGVLRSPGSALQGPVLWIWSPVN